MKHRSSARHLQSHGRARKRRISSLQRRHRRPSSDVGVAHLIEARAQDEPLAIAIEGAAANATYQELWSASERIARHFALNRTDDDSFVAVCLPRGFELLTVMLGAWRARLGFVPLDPHYPDERLRYMVEDSRAAILVCDATQAERFRGLEATVLEFSEIEMSGSSEPLPPLPGSNDYAYMIYTSGSTGRPKGVPICHGNLLNHNLWFGFELGLDTGIRCLHFCSPSFDAAMEEIFPTLAFGAALVVRQEELLAPAELVSFIAAQEINILNLPTAYWSEFVRALQRSELRVPPCVNTCVIGGEYANADTVRLWQHVAPHVRLLNMYGPTEATISSTCYDAAGGLYEGELPIGKAVAGHTAHIVDEYLRPVPPGQSGELCLAGPGLSIGYWGRDELTDERFPVVDLAGTPTRVYRTGDRVRFNDAGDLMFLGRLDSQVKIRGYRIELGEVESALLGLDEVEEAAVVLVPASEENGPYLFAAYVGGGDGSTVRAKLSAELPSYAVPARIEQRTSLPRLPNGKLDRRQLTQVPLHPAVGAHDGERLADNLTELALLDICKHVLGNEQLGVEDDFFAYGGHSLNGIEIIERANHAGLPLCPEDFFQDATVRGLAAAIDARLQDGAQRDSLVELQHRGDRPPVVFFHSMPGDLLGYGALVHHLGKLRPCIGLQALRPEPEQAATIESLAKKYATRIMQRYRPGALHLVGWCFGGHVAIEAARTLRAEGWHDVSLTMIEGYPVMGRAQHYVERALSLSKLSATEVLQFADARRHGRHREQLDDRALFALDSTHGAFSNRNAIHRANDETYRRYRSRSLDCSMLLIRGRQLPGTLLAGDYGWSKYMREVHTLQVDAEHQSILKEPNVREVADILKRWFARNELAQV